MIPLRLQTALERYQIAEEAAAAALDHASGQSTH
jgi:hypothetical protein